MRWLRTCLAIEYVDNNFINTSNFASQFFLICQTPTIAIYFFQLLTYGAQYERKRKAFAIGVDLTLLPTLSNDFVKIYLN